MIFEVHFYKINKTVTIECQKGIYRLIKSEYGGLFDELLKNKITSIPKPMRRLAIYLNSSEYLETNSYISEVINLP